MACLATGDGGLDPAAPELAAKDAAEGGAAAAPGDSIIVRITRYPLECEPSPTTTNFVEVPAALTPGG